MSWVGFEPTDSDLYLSFESQPSLSYRVRLLKSRDDYIELSTEENFKDFKGCISAFLETGDDRLDSPYYNTWSPYYRKTASPLEKHQPREADKERRKTIGCMYYVPAFRDEFASLPASYDLRVLVPKGKFDELLAAARLGRLPSAISIEVEGMDYGGAPDGSHKKWDNKVFPQLDIVSFSFSIPLVTQDVDDVQPKPSDNTFPASRMQAKMLLEKLEVLRIEIRSGLRSMLWALLVIGALVLFLQVVR